MKKNVFLQKSSPECSNYLFRDEKFCSAFGISSSTGGSVVVGDHDGHRQDEQRQRLGEAHPDFDLINWLLLKNGEK
jgi:hypothetical protein